MPKRSKKRSTKNTKKSYDNPFASAGPREKPILESFVNKRIKTQTITRVVNLGSVTSSIASDSNTAYSFKLSDLPSYTEFTALFDSFRFKEVEIELIPFVNCSTPASNTGDPRIYTGIDYDSATSVAINTLAQYESCRVDDGRMPVRRRLVPRAALAAYAGAFTSYAMAGPNQWYDCASPDIQFYGLMIGIPQQTTNTQSYAFNARYTLEFRATR